MYNTIKKYCNYVDDPANVSASNIRFQLLYVDNYWQKYARPYFKTNNYDESLIIESIYNDDPKEQGKIILLKFIKEELIPILCNKI